jgi:hypothetical protein
LRKLIRNKYIGFDDPNMSAGHQHKEEESGYHKRLIPVAWAILVMGLSLAIVILLYIWIGHIGPSYSSDTLQRQQQELRQQYHLPFKPTITDPKTLQTPPSLRGAPGYDSNPQ